MGPEERWERIRAYVVERLRAEVLPLPRGGQASIARQLDTSGAHFSNMLKSPPKIQPGEVFCRKAAGRWGMTYAELEALACGDPPPAQQYATVLRHEIEAAMDRRFPPAPDSERPAPLQLPPTRATKRSRG